MGKMFHNSIVALIFLCVCSNHILISKGLNLVSASMDAFGDFLIYIYIYIYIKKA